MTHQIANLCAALVMLVLLSPRIAAAQDEAGARAAFAEAGAHYENGRFGLAEQSFAQVYELLAGAPERRSLVLYNIARSQEEGGRLAEAADTYERYLRDAPADAPSRDEAATRIRDLRLRVGGGGGGASDGGPSGLFIAGLSLAIGGGVAGIVSIITGVVALDGEAQLDLACSGGSCPASERGLHDDTQTFALVTDIMWPTAVVLVGAGVALIVVDLLGGSSDSASLTPSVGCTADGCMAGLSGRFGGAL